jgi:hypothetical protein
VIDTTLTQAELLSMWECGEGARPSRRALALLSGAAPETAAEGLAEMSVGRRDAALLSLRERLFGSAFTGVTTCPACGEEIEIAFDAEEVRREVGGATSVRIVDGEYEVEARLPSSADLAAIDAIVDLDAARECLFARCVVQATRGGETIEAGDVPESAVALVARAMAALDPQADVQLALACPSCAHAWREPFDVATFLWSEVSAFARRLLGDVHDLARAYGWSEQAILDLSPARRNAYLEIVR